MNNLNISFNVKFGTGRHAWSTVVDSKPGFSRIKIRFQYLLKCKIKTFYDYGNF